MLPEAAGRHAASIELPENAYIAGRWIEADSGARVEVFNPSTGALIGSVPDMGAAEARRAIEAAAGAFPRWRGLLPQMRAALLKRWHDLIVAERETLARLMTREQGKPLREARGEIDYGASFVEWFAEEAKRLDGESPLSHLPSRRMTVRREPVGVVACVTPWNFPSAMLTRKAAAALAAGCTVVARPASETPFSALALAALAEQAGIPAGVFNVVTGDPETIVGEFCANPLVRAISFTGSTEIGKALIEQSAGTVKRVTMELGGHAPFIVFPDTDLDEAVAAAVDAKFQTTGQDCLAANRIYVHEAIYEDFVARFTAAVRRLKVGDGFDEGVDLGPLMHERAVAKCLHHVRDAVTKGARLTTAGAARRLFVEPAVLADVTPAMAIFHEETFGPVAALIRFSSEAEVVASANDSRYGLAAYLFTRDHDRICRLTDALETGMIAVNCVQMTGYPVPFGGVRESGLGREGGRHGIEEFTHLKYVCAAFRAA
ncbi:NAD-dependent succinate-semialdehyde dehydrogenase [Propylenella binzhouense]|uniref:NAD-dependent succinate-semialdehyde dehydrogenase n=1 Tax=Propylenella binzhouense TaxID=2555902 RepID=A0A964T0U2_9HYPH|nr:NAD-dependent succinate-semialdehyde dehydrogenase [Propylenella binzhouense]MYZ46331.1 NAD-dependent succinate-semialdehyde dehydrogenase [Propylenella binzhouense]